MAKKNATEYRNRVITKIASKLTKYEVEENELDNQTKQEIQHLKNGEITQPEKLVETEIRIIQKIGEKGAEKKITYFTQEVETILKTKDEEKKESLKMNLMDFIASKNVYYQTQKAQAEALLNRLQNNTQDRNNTSSNFPYGVVIPLSLLGLVLVIILVIAFRKKRKVSQIKKVNFRKF